MYFYIVNPAAGKGAVNSIQDKLKLYLKRLGIEGEFIKTVGKGDASALANKAIEDGYKTLVVVGGDATLNEVIGAVYRTGRQDLAIGIIPIGTKNYLATTLNIHNWKQACSLLARRRLFEYPLMTVNNYVFLNSLILTPLQETSTPDSFSYLVEVDKQFKLRGTTNLLEVYNQKFLNVHLDSRLLLRITAANTHSSPFRKLYLTRNSPARRGYTQIHAKQLRMTSKRGAMGRIDGRPVRLKTFEVGLTDTTIKLISADLTRTGV